MTRVADVARVLLACVRLTMGTAGLLAPGAVIRRLQIDPSGQPGMRYPLRMFGIRTVLIAADLLRSDGPDRQHAVLLAPVVHGTDTVSAYLAWRRGDLPSRAGTMTTAISAVNLVLALLSAVPAPRPPAQRRAAWGATRPRRSRARR